MFISDIYGLFKLSNTNSKIYFFIARSIHPWICMGFVDIEKRTGISFKSLFPKHYMFHGTLIIKVP